jgi:predicted nucleic acid-binding protein
MILAADASFLVSLYGGDVKTPTARAWMARTAEPIVVSSALRFETENALRLACFQRKLSSTQLRQSLAEIESDFGLGFLIARDLPAGKHWSECRRLSSAHTLTRGFRAFDILHVAAALLLKADCFLTFDERQTALAEAVGLAVEP